MNEKLKEFLDAKKDTEIKNFEETKQKTLIDLGLFEKVYSPDNKYSEEFSLYEWDNTNKINKYYKKVAIEITDEEYQEVKKYSKEEVSTESNAIATALTIIAWIIFIVGFITGVFIASIAQVEFSFVIAFVYWCACFMSGTMFLGFAEIIKLLDAIKRK